MVLPERLMVQACCHHTVILPKCLDCNKLQPCSDWGKAPMCSAEDKLLLQACKMTKMDEEGLDLNSSLGPPHACKPDWYNYVQRVRTLGLNYENSCSRRWLLNLPWISVYVCMGLSAPSSCSASFQTKLRELFASDLSGIWWVISAKRWYKVNFLRILSAC